MEKKVIKKASVVKKTTAAVPPSAKKKTVKKAAKDIVLKDDTAAVAASPVKKGAKKAVKKRAKKATFDATPALAAAEPHVELSPVFKALADVSLSELQRENRARLQMQTPTRLYFYWSVKEDPHRTLKRTFGGDTGSYTLVVKLTNLRTDREVFHPAEAEGTWWFDVEPDGEYRAEIGFYAPNRPYFRIVYSNTVTTPRRSPSPHPASEARWTVSANKFAEVLDVAGFSRDAFDVAIAGDDTNASDVSTHTAFSRFIGKRHDLNGVAAEDIRYVMIALAAGATLEDLRFRISPTLFAVLQANTGKLAAGRAKKALTEYFDIDEAEFVEEHLGSGVYGASLINFPRTLKTRTAPRYAPLSSHSLR